MTQNPRPRTSRALPLPALIGLALLGTPRVILHDLGLLHEGSAVNLLFVVVPPALWIAVVQWRRVPRPFLTLLTVGALYGLLLALCHQLLWSAAFAGAPPELGGNLADLEPGVQAVVLRSAAVLSSVVTGTAVGAFSGGIAVALRRRRPAPAPHR